MSDDEELLSQSDRLARELVRLQEETVELLAEASRARVRRRAGENGAELQVAREERREDGVMAH